MTLNAKTVAFINEHFGGKHKKNKQKGGVKRLFPTIILISMALWLEMMFAWDRNIEFDSIKVLHKILIISGTPMRKLVVEAAQEGWVRTVMERFHIETWLLKDGKEMPYDVNTCGDMFQNIDKYLGFSGMIGYPTPVRELRPEIGDGMGHTIGNCEEEAMQATIFAWNIISLIIPIILTSGLWFITKEKPSPPDGEIKTVSTTTLVHNLKTPFDQKNVGNELQLNIKPDLIPVIKRFLENPRPSIQQLLPILMGPDLSKKLNMWSPNTLTQSRELNTVGLPEIQEVIGQLALPTNKNITKRNVNVNILTFVAQLTVNGWKISPCQGNQEIRDQCLRIFNVLKELYIKKAENTNREQLMNPKNFALEQLVQNNTQGPEIEGPGPEIEVLGDTTGGRKKKRKKQKSKTKKRQQTKKKKKKTKKKKTKKKKTKKKKSKSRFSGKESYCRCIRAKKKKNKTKKNGYVSYCRCFEVA